MAHLLFIDESGCDLKESPYEVLAGVSVADRDLWNLIKSLHQLEYKHFGRRYSSGPSELKARKVLKKKVFRHAAQLSILPYEERVRLAHACLDNGPGADSQQIAALAQAKLAFVQDVFSDMARFHCRVFASVVEKNAIRPEAGEYIRKDYAYLFERFHYFLEDMGHENQGLVVFDELEKAKSHILINQMYRYFRDTAKGKMRADRIIPEPFFVHSDLTTGVQLADLAAYVLSWGFRTPSMAEPARPELSGYADQIASLRYRAIREIGGKPDFVIWSVAHITDLRCRADMENEEERGL
ncbi:MAG: hypothetical protein A2487_18025 [Candidatus Raymondbacteria bacterium RifOxyC12_full_50_8]|uniref:DUF3800 domain-containing protein n=1 Tax=Candidatus Raymondbacteria bacterium RIFOXYD12_FULL_49_13 TaxID=1817890 RepID=A0A1F7FGZ3_UNCRA|nr:MAG: hypothetical protein A2248_05025 [Candidatus Raymondbacteria bacterium RIFOXYA2_FULL_49_16]OGJ99266.1 MAG: hypothetical protein A2350_05325 [Candidatus Raymondbacteria bacterium RifOxyB12_full_50_8]OGK04750.1 MAG: hypothetical protein A2487_18025 [Candidatus Raymondbacteria bacterium RifOxyC12_full_50_8]OGK05858.1 MAG: hypothetical protein A2519_04200 [Candidatus Raymondbacteria bacterium RIFOXYD12_FULL_49_13]OGP43352.1 MAG: hypothetical protein A2324_02665 [Candidatus Raymondbacteria b